MKHPALKALGLSAIVIPAMLAMTQPGTPLRVQPASRLWINGTSTVRSFQCDAKSFDATVDATVPEAIAAVLAGEKSVEAVTLTVLAEQLDCRNGTMNEHMMKAIKGKQFTAIVFRLDSYDLAKEITGACATLHGTLTLGGVAKAITIDAQVQAAPDGALKVSGKVPLRMTEYGLQPPKLMLGTLKVNELVNVSFELLLKP